MRPEQPYSGAWLNASRHPLATLLLPDSGSVTVAGFDAVQDYRKVRRALGCMPESFTVYQELTVDDFATRTGHNGLAFVELALLGCLIGVTGILGWQERKALQRG